MSSETRGLATISDSGRVRQGAGSPWDSERGSVPEELPTIALCGDCGHGLQVELVEEVLPFARIVTRGIGLETLATPEGEDIIGRVTPKRAGRAETDSEAGSNPPALENSNSCAPIVSAGTGVRARVRVVRIRPEAVTVERNQNYLVISALTCVSS